MNIYDFFDYATATTQTIIDKVTTDHTNVPTPCTDWNVGELVEHMFGVSGQAKAMAAGVDVAEKGSTPDTIGDDVAASYTFSVDSVRAAFADTAIFETTLATPMGPHPGRVVFTVTALEHLTHGWDLAAAIRVPLEIDPVAVGYAFRAIEDMPDVIANFRNWGAYAPPLPTDDTTDPTGALLALLGRDALWGREGRSLG